MNTKAIRKVAAALLASCLLASAALPSFADPMPAERTAAQTSILDLTTEYLKNPLGIDTDTPRFGWRMESSLIGQMQTAYEVNLYKDGEPGRAVWTTGRVENGLSVGVNYDGEPLEAATRYFWTVKVWDKDGKTVVSQPSYFETGVTEEQEWLDTEFIQLPASSSAPIFRTEQQLGGAVDSARLYITAGGIYEAYINGQQVGKVEGDKTTYHHMNPGYGNGNVSLGYETYDVTSYLKGQDAVALSILGGNGWINVRGDSVMGNNSGQPAVKAMLKLSYTDADGQKQEKTIQTNTKDWAGTLDGPVTANGVYYGEDYDARRAQALGDFTQVGYDDSGWMRTNESKEPTAHILRNSFDAVQANYVRLSVSETGPATKNDGENRLQIMELQLLDTAGNNVAAGLTATASNNFSYGSQWRVENLTDGDDGMQSGCGYTSNILGYGQTSFRPDQPVTIDFQLKQPAVISSMNLYCRTSLESVSSGLCPNYPKVYSVQVSEDGNSWKDVVTDFDAGNVKNEVLATEGITTASYPGKIIAQRGESGQIVDAYEQRPVSATLYTGQAASSSYTGGEIAVDSYYAYDAPQDALYQNGFVQVGKDKELFDGGITLKKGQTMVINMGQNVTAIPDMEIQSVPGATVTMRFGEMLNDGSSVGGGGTQADGPKGSVYFKSLRGARSSVQYTFAGSGIERYQTKTSFFGYQYISVTATEDVTIHSIRSRAVSSVSEQTGEITTNNKDVNRLFLNALYGQLSNYFTAPTDCPQRDERHAWTGDTQVFAQTAMYNFDSVPFLNGFQDLTSENTLRNGFPGAVTSNAGYFAHWAAGWSDVEVINAWTLYSQTGDKSILEDNWEALNHYMDFLKSRERAQYQSPMALGNAFGDWLAFQGTGLEVITDYYYGYVNQLMVQIAQVLGREDAAQQYQDYFEHIKETFLKTHVSFNEEADTIPATLFDEPTDSNPGASNVITNRFDDVTARFVRMTVSQTGPGTANDNEYRLQMMEAEVSKDGEENFALNKPVEASDAFFWPSQSNPTQWAPVLLTDGDDGLVSDKGYTSNNAGTNNLSGRPITVTIDLQQPQTVNQLKIDCRITSNSMKPGACANYPADYILEVSPNGTNWTKVGRYATQEREPEKLVIKSGTGTPVFMNKGGKFEDNSQTALLWMLKLGFYDSEEMKQEAIRLLVENIRNENPDPTSVRANYGENTLSVGFLGSNVITPVLTDIGCADVSYDLLLQDTMPSWLFEVKAGATTIWERWNSFDPDKGFGDSEMNSFNHYSYGSVVEWMYKYMVGISADSSAPGFKNIILQPTLDTGEAYNDQERIHSVSGSYDSYYGPIESNWTSDAGSLKTYHAVIPANTTATLYLPVSQGEADGFQNISGIAFDGMVQHNGVTTAQFTLQAGGYDFTVSDGKLTAAVADGYATGETQTDKSVLEAAVDAAAAYENREDEYTADSWKAFRGALDNANTVLKNDQADQELIDAAAKQLNDAIAGLTAVNPPEPGKADKTILNKVIAKAGALMTTEEFSNAILSVQQSYTEALAAAKAVAERTDAEQGEVDAAWVALMTEIHKLGLQQGDKTLLQEHYNLYSKLNLENYLDNQAKENFKSALEAAEKLLAGSDAVQSEIDEADNNLIAAAAAMTLRSDKTALQNAVDSTKDYAEENYAKGWAAFEAARDAANEVLSNPEAAQDEIDKAVDALIDAMLNLRLKADKQLLNAVIAAAQALDVSGYSRASVDVFQTALAEAKKKAEDENLSKDEQEQVDAAVQTLTEAVEGLRNSDGTSANLSVDGDGNITGARGAAKTGENSPIPAAVALMLLAGTAIFVKRRK